MDGPDVGDIDLVIETAALARLDVDAEEARTLGPQFAAILRHFEVLAQLDVDDVEPTAGLTPVEGLTRPDEPRPSLEREVLLANAPDPEDGFYGVPKTIGGPS